MLYEPNSLKDLIVKMIQTNSSVLSSVPGKVFQAFRRAWVQKI